MRAVHFIDACGHCPPTATQASPPHVQGSAGPTSRVGSCRSLGETPAAPLRPVATQRSVLQTQYNARFAASFETAMQVFVRARNLIGGALLPTSLVSRVAMRLFLGRAGQHTLGVQTEFDRRRACRQRPSAARSSCAPPGLASTSSATQQTVSHRRRCLPHVAGSVHSRRSLCHHNAPPRMQPRATCTWAASDRAPG